jgi:hypothetical protein
VRQYFDIVRVDQYTATWYTPVKMFLSLQNKTSDARLAL